MRATYEDLLRAARRIGVNAQRATYVDESELLADWNAVLMATATHLRWLRTRLTVTQDLRVVPRESDRPLGRLARAIGAGADLLALQDPGAACALDVWEDLAAARGEVAAIALLGGRVVMRGVRTAVPARRRVATVLAELESIAQGDVGRTGLGTLAGLAAGWPAAPVDDLSMVAGTAVRWERAHGETPPKALLTRDLRSTTAQLRMVCGHAWHIADALLAAPAAELDAGQRLDLQVLRAALRAVDAGAMRVAQSWQRRLSDLNGRSEAPGEVAFVDLKSVLDRVVRGHDGLRSPDELVTSRLVAARLLDALDELVWSAEQVARGQQSAVAGLIREGRMFVPRRDVARLELAYLRRPGGGSRPLQAWWVRTNLANCFDDLTNALAWSADHLTRAADVARRLAGTSRMSRRGAEQQPRMPAPYLDLPGIGDPGQEMSVLDR